MVEVASEFDFLVANLGDLGDSAFEIGLHGVTHGVELHADGFDFVLRRNCAEPGQTLKPLGRKPNKTWRRTFPEMRGGSSLRSLLFSGGRTCRT